MAVSGPLFWDLTPPNLESRTKKNGHEMIGRSFQRAIVCLTAPGLELNPSRDLGIEVQI